MGTKGLSTKTHNPSRWLTSERSGLARRSVRQSGQFHFGACEQLVAPSSAPPARHRTPASGVPARPRAAPRADALGLILGYFVFLAAIGLGNQVWLPQMRDAGASGGLGPVGFLAMLALRHRRLRADECLVKADRSAAVRRPRLDRRARRGGRGRRRAGRPTAIAGISRVGSAHRRPLPARRDERLRAPVMQPVSNKGTATP